MKKKVIIIGSGFGGLAVGCRLAVRGFDVDIYEKRDRPGGKAYVYELNGFKFDGGPGVISAPYLFDDLFKITGKHRQDYFDLIPVEPNFRIFNRQGITFDYVKDFDLILTQIDRLSPLDKEGYQRFIQSIYGLLQKGLVELSAKPFNKINDLLEAIPGLIRLKTQPSVYDYISGFIKDEFLRQVFSLHPLLLGGNPFETSNIFSVLHQLQVKWGVFAGNGGTGAIVDGIMRLFFELGGSLYLENEVSEILTQGRTATGIRLADGSIRYADAVISNADLAFTYRYLLPEKSRRKYSDQFIENLHYSNSLFVMYLGLRQRYDKNCLTRNNILIGDHFKETIEDIYINKKLTDHLLLFLYLPTQSDPTLAPPGCESICVVAPVPNQDSGIDWSKMARPYRDRILQFLERNYFPDLRANIIAEHYIDPSYFERSLNSYKGSAYSLQPTLDQYAWFRPHNRSEDINNLYFVGAGTHPGAGLPGVLTSAEIVSKIIQVI
jgi:phytoene desaturase